MEKKHDGSKICVKRVEDLLSEAEKKSEGERNKAHWTKIKKFVPKLLHNETKVGIFHIRDSFIRSLSNFGALLNIIYFA